MSIVLLVHENNFDVEYFAVFVQEFLEKVGHSQQRQKAHKSTNYKEQHKQSTKHRSGKKVLFNLYLSFAIPIISCVKYR
ncbi:hypothetical protein BpHYR1_000576 [Brachionus plicatilis]|uniref:Uncharacterized protein n=1 Tax=Brachionus plicatilis TaxID=10195 RepID=A0A3M7T469_BRAPC|nr:hypothetical protein BpHYR1_000576 [Brachionus plicatilis]